MGSEGGWTSPAFDELLPQLPRGEQLRLQSHLRDRDRRWRRCRYNKTAPPAPSSTQIRRQEKERDARMIPHVQNALRYYNARHPGGEFDAVKPLMQTRVWFRGQHWLHINFLARSRSSNKIKRFFAELHYKPLLNISGFVSLEQLPDPLPVPVAIVETCTIIEEPLDRYRRSCAFCPGQFDILHPMSDRKFVCGNDEDRFYQKLTHCNQLQFDLPFM